MEKLGKKSVDLKIVLAAVTICSISACAVIYEDADGGQRIVGLADVVVVPAGPSPAFAGKIVTVRTAGLMLNAVEGTEGFSLGYARKTFGKLRNCGIEQFPNCVQLENPRAGSALNTGLAAERNLPGDGKGYFGFVSVTVPVSGAAFPLGGTIDSTELVGVSVARRLEGLDLAIGYLQSDLYAIRDNVFVKLAPDRDNCHLSGAELALGRCR